MYSSPSDTCTAGCKRTAVDGSEINYKNPNSLFTCFCFETAPRACIMWIPRVRQWIATRHGPVGGSPMRMIR